MQIKTQHVAIKVGKKCTTVFAASVRCAAERAENETQDKITERHSLTHETPEDKRQLLCGNGQNVVFTSISCFGDNVATYWKRSTRSKGTPGPNS